MPDVFLSYKAEDRARVKPLVEAFVAEGLSVWWDVHIEGGASWRATIGRQLDSAKCAVVVWSSNSAGELGHFVHDEASRARSRGVYLPVAIDAVHLPLGFGQEHVLKLVAWRGDRNDPYYLDVLAAVRSMVSGGPRAIPKARASVSTPRARRKWWSAAAVLASALLVSTGLVLTGAPARLCSTAGLRCEWLGGSGAAPTNSVAVLPFTNLSSDPQQQYFSDGLSEELIDTLSRLRPLQIVARTSSFKFKDSKEDSATIGSKLGVAYLLDGSVSRQGSIVRVRTELVESKTGFARWSQSYDKDLKDIFAVQSEIAQSVAESMKVQLLSGDVAALQRRGTLSPVAYDALLKGRRLFDSGGGESGYRDALAQFDAAIAADPDFAAAYAARARTLVTIAIQFTPAQQLRQVYDAALAAAHRAVDLAPDLPAAQAALASAAINANLDFATARRAYASAIRTGGGDANILISYGPFTALLGDFDPALAAARRGAALDPLNPRAFNALSRTCYAARRYPEAVAAMRQALSLNPKAYGAHAAIGDILILQGKLADAKAEFALEPEAWQRLTGQAILFRRMGDVAAANTAMKTLTTDFSDVGAYQQAQIYAQWGDKDRALAALGRAFVIGDSGVLLLKTDPFMDPLRADPRFAVLLARLKIDPESGGRG